MNKKRFWLAFVATYIVYQALGFVVHQVWLTPVYQEIAEVFRPREQMDTMVWIFSLTSAVVVLIFCYVFTRGYEGRGIGEGVRYGVLMGLFMMVVQAYDSYVIYPLPYHLVLKWFFAGMVTFVVMGIVVALVYKLADQ
jgi:glycerol uptake facilitator-like aquaporin